MSDILTILVVGLSAMLASTIAAVAGFGGAAIMLPILVWAFGVRDAVPILTVAQLLGNFSRVVINRSELNLRVVKWFSFGAVPAAVIGGILFATTPAGGLVRFLGAFLIALVLYRHTPWGKQTKMSLKGFLPLGVLSGFMSAVLGTVGPFMAPFFLAFGLVKGAYIGTEALSTVVMHITKLGVYGRYSLLDIHSVLIGLAIGGIMFLGSYLGKRILDRVSPKVFPYIIEAVLIVAGVQFLITG